MVGVEPLQAIARKCEPGNTSVQLGSSVWRRGAGGGWAEAEEPPSKLRDQEDEGAGGGRRGG